MTNEVTTQNQSTEVANMSVDEWGADGISAQDIVVPKILAMQGLSKQVMDGKARFGEFIDSLTNEKVGDLSTPIEFIPFHLEKIWIISKIQGNTSKFEKTEQCTPMNENRPYEEKVNGLMYKNQLCMNFYVLRKADMSLPSIISFKGMSLRAGRSLATQMFIRNRQLGLVPAGYVMKLSGRKTENDKGTFVTLAVEPGEKSTAAEVKMAYDWLKTIKSKPVKVHDVEETPTNAPDDVQF